MAKTLRVAVLSAAFVLLAAPVFAGPGGADPPPPPPTNNVTTSTTVAIAILTLLGS
jgi:hypothetical protein